MSKTQIGCGRWLPLLAVTMCAPMMAGCANSGTNAELPRGAAAYETFPAPATDVVRDYRIGPRDVLAITTFKESDLSFPQIQVDAAGSLQFPLIGKVQAAGLTSNELAQTIAERLNRDYLKRGEVSVIVVETLSQTVTVEGNVVEPGVFEIPGSSTLLQAIARARSPTRVAQLDEVMIFRQINGKRVGARFDLKEIRAGRAPDPEILGGDIVVVGFDSLKGAFRDFLTTAPFFNIFQTF